MDECDVKMEENGGYLQQTIHFSVPYATTKIRLDDFVGAKEIAFSVEFIGFNNDKRLHIFNPMQGGFATTSIFYTINLFYSELYLSGSQNVYKFQDGDSLYLGTTNYEPINAGFKHNIYAIMSFNPPSYFRI